MPVPVHPNRQHVRVLPDVDAPTLLHGDLVRIAEIAVEDAARAIAEGLEGTVLVIPTRAMLPPTFEHAKLPHLLFEVRRLIGHELASRFADAYGGRTVYIPSRRERVNAISALLGKSAAGKLAEAYGNENIKVPIAPTGQVLSA